MAVRGLGFDIVDVASFTKLLAELHDCFTPSELSDIGNGVDMPLRLAGRFAAKEAVFKSMGTGRDEGMSWTDVEILTEESGKPFVILHGTACDAQMRLRIKKFHISISHDGAYAGACAIAE